MENHKGVKNCVVLRTVVFIFTLLCKFVLFANDVPTVDPLNPNIPQISSGYSVGASNVSFSVSEYGAAEFSFAIGCPVGGHLTPQISLSYNSQNAFYGIVGYGINLSGISVITRGEKTPFNNNGCIGGVTHDADDNLFLDGKRLILQSGESSQEGANYYLEGDPYTVIIAHGYYDDSLANTWFEVHTADGKIHIYGNTSDSRVEFKDDKGRPRIASWYIQSIEDVYGDIISYIYDIHEYYAYPRFIIYGSNSRSERGLINSIEFDYEDLGTQSAILSKNSQKASIGSNGKFYWKPFYGNQYVSTVQLVKCGKSLSGVTGPLCLAIDVYEVHNSYTKNLNNGDYSYYLTTRTTASKIGSWSLGTTGIYVGAIWVTKIGGTIGLSFGGIGAAPAAIIGGFVGGIVGTFSGEWLGGQIVDVIYCR